MNIELKAANQTLTSPLDHYQLLHCRPYGTVILWDRQVDGDVWHKVQPADPPFQKLSTLDEKEDIFFSVNEFIGWRRVKLLKSLRACYVDIDNCTDLDAVLATLLFAKLPAPSFVVFSGRGLHLYWLLVPLPAKALPIWQRVQNKLIDALATHGSDPAARDCTRVLRMVGSINRKNGHQVYGRILSSQRCTLHELADKVLGPRKPKPPKPPKPVVRNFVATAVRKGRRISNHGSIYERWHLVYQDLIKIAKHHGGTIPEGHRDKFLFLSAVSLSWFTNPASLQSEIAATARDITPGLSEKEAERYTKPVIERASAAADGKTIEFNGMKVDPRYHFRRSTLYRWMRDIIDPELLTELRAIIPDSLAAQREKERQAKRDRVAEGRYKTYQKDSLSRQKPWEAEGISRATWYRREAAKEG